MKHDLTVLSFGAGVQSTALLWLILTQDERLLSVAPELPTFAVFGDTMQESRPTQAHLARMQGECIERSFELIIARDKGDLGESFEKRATPSIPFFYERPSGREGMMQRQCTNNWKIRAVVRECRRKLGLKPRQRMKGKYTIEVWLGISTDEITRMKESRDSWQHNRFPLIELNWSREDCAEYIESIGEQVPPKSACVWCPYHSDAFYHELRDISPEDWAEACRFDEAIRKLWKDDSNSLPPRDLYVHRSLRPLAELDLSKPQLELFEMADECDGYCGL